MQAVHHSFALLIFRPFSGPAVEARPGREAGNRVKHGTVADRELVSASSIKLAQNLLDRMKVPPWSMAGRER
jgi:hypothetical protein